MEQSFTVIGGSSEVGFVLYIIEFSIYFFHCSSFINFEKMHLPQHPMFLEHWYRQKILSYIRQRFSYLFDELISKKCKKNFFRGGFFFKSTLSVLRSTWTDRINLKIFLGHHIAYLSIWPFMCHPWFPTRKASKLTFVGFQHQVLNTLQGLDKWSWKQTNVGF